MIANLARELEEIYTTCGTRRYGLETISQMQHALQAANLAETAGEPPAMIVAALLHDVGHLIGTPDENLAAEGIDDRHECLGAAWLLPRLGESVSAPVRRHVSAKRYLCTTEAAYRDSLAPDSIVSLKLQGGPMNDEECAAFEALPFAKDAIRLRRLDEAAKDPHATTPPFAYFLRYLPQARIGRRECETFAQSGLVVLRDFFSADETAGLNRHSRTMGAAAHEQLAAANQAGISPARQALPNAAALIAVPEATNDAQICRFEYLQGACAEFRAFVARRVAPVIEALAGEAFIPFKDKENEKHPGGGGFGAHQDYTAYQAFGPRYNITAMLTIDPATRANGCLEFARAWRERVQATWVGRRVEGHPLLRSNAGGANHGDIAADIEAALEWDAVETGPADLVLFDSFVPHRSAPNRSCSSRRAMFLTFNAAREGDWYERYYAEKRAHFDDPKFHVSTPTAHAM
ncbi:MAG TPA: phytanoyl-CoA dioxygenase family protein [Rhizomicrobium sp.]|jgi:phosphonate degradation associated HDIG domain protein|nr:phytanoyl-CoA dioxygenase family protein [Rhizomicrobium sp.]